MVPLLGYFLVWIGVGTHLVTKRGLGAAIGVVKLVLLEATAVGGAITAAGCCKLLLPLLLLVLLLALLVPLLVPLLLQLLAAVVVVIVVALVPGVVAAVAGCEGSK